MKHNNHLIDYKTIYEFLFLLLEQYRDLFNKRNGQYKDYDEIYHNFIKLNFWYLNFLYTTFYLSIDLSSSECFKYYSSLLQIYSKCNPNLKELKLDFENQDSLKDEDLKIVASVLQEDHKLIRHLYDDLYFYHYTNTTALKKILEGHNLKFSNLDKCSNDKTEGNYLDNYLRSLFNDDLDDYKNIKLQQVVYSFSLSCQADDVAQWARYANYDGVCLVFSCNLLFDYISEYLKKAKDSFFVCPLRYTKFENIQTKDMAAELSLYNLQTRSNSIYNQLRFMFKHISFESEREFRLFFCNDKKRNNISEIEIFSFSSDGSLMMDLSKNKFSAIIPEIIFGPETREKEKKEIKNLMAKLGYTKIKCINSSCPIKINEDKKNLGFTIILFLIFVMFLICLYTITLFL